MKEVVTVYAVLQCDICKRILKVIKKNPGLSYTQLHKIFLDDVHKTNYFSYHIRKLRTSLLVSTHQHQYILTYKGKRFMDIVAKLEQLEKINMENYPSCLKVRVSDALTDEELLNLAVTKIIKEVKKLK